MKNTELIEKLQWLVHVTRFPIHLFSSGELVWPEVENKMDDPFTSNMDLLRNCMENDIYYESDAIIYYKGFQISDDYFCVIGPVSSINLDAKHRVAYLHSKGMRSTFNYAIPRASILQVYDVLKIINALTDNQINIPCLEDNTDFDIHSSNTEMNAENIYELRKYSLEQTEVDAQHYSYVIEVKLIEAFRNSDKELFYQAVSEISNYSLGHFAASTIKEAEYSAVLTTGLLTRNAMAGIVPPAEAYSLSDYLLSRISSFKTEKEYTDFMPVIYNACLDMVKRFKHTDESSLYVKRAKDYIIKHLNKKLSPGIIASELGISPDYLFHLFKSSVGNSPMNYVQQERITAASNMLKYSDYDISLIANYFQFKTQSHFTAVFKKYTGLTPAEYRRTNKWE